MIAPEIKAIGFGAPPHGVIQVLNGINFHSKLTIYLFEPLTNTGELPFDEIAARADKQNVFVIVMSGEGHAYREFRQFIDRLINECGVIPKNICIHSSALIDSNDSPVHLIGTISNIIGHLDNKVDLALDTSFGLYAEPSHHYVCLNRLHRWERASLVQELLDRGLSQYGKISYASGTPDEVKIDRVRLDFKKEYRHLLPMLIDKENVDYQEGFKVRNPAITGALFNIVTESAFETWDNDQYASHIIAQHTAGITEKTFKAFVLGQIPVLVAPYGTVTATRTIGFDMYDDIVDHSYDLEKDPVKRLTLVTNEIERLCNLYSVNDLIILKKNLLLRQSYNVQTLMHWRYNHTTKVREWVTYFKNQGACIV